MKKKIIAATMAAAMCVSLAACGGSTAASSAAESTASSTAESTASSTADAASTGDEEVDLRMAWWGSQDRHDRTIKAIELYESLHPNVKIEYEYYSFDDYFTKLKTLVASDQVWDIFQLGGNFPMYMDKIYPLDDYIASGVVDVSGIGDANLKTTQDTEGHQLGISNGLNSYGIAYDPDMFAEAGVAEPTDTWTWDDYANAANTIHEKLGIGLLHICTAVRFLHGGGVTNLTIYTSLSHAAKLPPKLSAQPVTEKLESAIIGVTANPHCRQLQEREPDEPNNSKRRSPCAGWRTGIAAGRLRHGAAVCPRTGIHSAGTRYPDHELVGGRCPHRNLPAGHPGI